MNYCVLIPSYNEAKTIGGIIKRLRSRNIAVYVVDDGSSDDTYSIAVSEGAIAFKHQMNMGKGASLREGFRQILNEKFDAVITMDGDDQHEIDSIDDFVRRIAGTGSGMVVGNRMSDTASMPLVRKVTNRFMSWLISKISGQYIPDTQCGFRLIGRRILEAVTLESSNFEIESELILKAARLGFKIESVPVKTVYRNEESRINPVIDTIRFFLFLIKMAFKK